MKIFILLFLGFFSTYAMATRECSPLIGGYLCTKTGSPLESLEIQFHHTMQSGEYYLALGEMRYYWVPNNQTNYDQFNKQYYIAYCENDTLHFKIMQGKTLQFEGRLQAVSRNAILTYHIWQDFMPDPKKFNYHCSKN